MSTLIPLVKKKKEDTHDSILWPDPMKRLKWLPPDKLASSCCHCASWPGLPLQRHLQNPPVWSSSSLKQEFIPTRDSSHAQYCCGYSESTNTEHRATGTRWEQTEGWTVKDQQVLWVEGGEDIAKEEWVGREKRRREEELGNKWQQNKDSSTKWEGACWPAYRHVLSFFCFF